MNYATTNTRKFSILVSSVLVGTLLVVGAVSAATTISTDISTGGNLTVSGTSTLATTTLTNLTSSGTATSTFAGGLNLTSGCYALSGNCIGAGGGGSGTVNSGQQGQVAFYNANGTVVSATSSLTISPSGNVAIGATLPGGAPASSLAIAGKYYGDGSALSGITAGAGGVNSQTGTSYIFANSDCGKNVTFSNLSAISVTLPQAGSGGNFASGCVINIQNINVGAITITATTSTIDGIATLGLVQNQGVSIWSNGSNYFTQRGAGVSLDPLGSGIVLLPNAGNGFNFVLGYPAMYNPYLGSGGFTHSVLLGGASYTNSGITAMGWAATASGHECVAMGYDAACGADNGIAIGTGVTTANSAGIAIGTGTTSGGANDLAIGVAAHASGNNTTAVGSAANTAGFTYSTAIGYQAAATDYYQFVAGGPNLANFYAGSTAAVATIHGRAFQTSAPYTVSTLPACNSGGLLTVAGVSDATAFTPGAALTGGGTFKIPVVCIYNGSAYVWLTD